MQNNPCLNMGNNEILIKKEWAVNADLLYYKADNKTKSESRLHWY